MKADGSVAHSSDCFIFFAFRLVLPLVTREVTSLLSPGHNASETLDLSTFGFLYGTFPTAPAVFVFSTQYNLEVDMVRELHGLLF